MNKKVILTGIKPSGMPHLGNYCGAIKPMVEQVNNKKDNETIYMFIPDIHVVNGGLEPAKIREFTNTMLATYLACGLDPSKVVIYRQSAVRQHAELATLLNNFTPKGMMNRAHSYKAAVDKNLITVKNLIINIDKISTRVDLIEYRDACFNYILETTSEENANKFIELISNEHINRIEFTNPKDAARDIYFLAENLCNINKIKDQNINMGLYSYPILMAADILLYHTNTVPVGKDQIQHIEMARDIAKSFNARYSETFVLPDYESKEDAPEIAGLDGRKMSKSYGNHIPMFCNEMELKGYIKKIITDSARPEDPKNIEGSTIVQLYELFASEDKIADFKARLAKGGLSYGDAKNELYELINAELSEKRAKYNELLKDKSYLNNVLQAGEEQARRVAEKTMVKVRRKMGLVSEIKINKI